MKTALIMTTINVPVVLALYRKLDPDVRFFVALENGVSNDIAKWIDALPNSAWTLAGSGADDYACSQLIGWKTISRRNVALLEALKWGAEAIVSIDDDNIPIDEDYFHNFREVFDTENRFMRRAPFNGIKATSVTRWFDPGSLQFPMNGGLVCQRGFPQTDLNVGATFEPITEAKVGVAQGMILGDPDTSAVDRISRHPTVHQVSELLRAGIVTDPRECYAPLNSQNIAFVRELAPCFLMVPVFGRYDDIYASLLAQRVMREHNFHVHFGQPFVWQQRNAHNLLRDLAAEQWGAEHILEFTAWLDGFILKDVTPVAAMRILFTNLPDWMPDRGKLEELGLAWASDCEQVMK